MPIIANSDYIPKDLIGFNEALTSKNTGSGVHFFIDDYQFERIWREPDRYLTIIKRFDGMLTPDFSLYADMPISLQIYNTYRSRFIGQYYQLNEVDVLPTVGWSDYRSFDFCFNGLQTGGTVAVSTVGCMKNKNARKLWRDGFDEMNKRLKPKTIIIYGQEMETETDAEIIYFKNKIIERARL